MSAARLKNLIIRTSVVRASKAGYIFTEDPTDESPHTLIFKYVNGEFVESKANFNMHSVCLISQPEPGLIALSGAGLYSSMMTSGTRSANLLDEGLPAPSVPRISGLRSVATIGGRAYAVGLRGMVYRFDKPGSWTRLDEGLPESFNAQASHGLSESELYVVGREGQIFLFDGTSWSPCASPTNATLTSVQCTPEGEVYIGGHGGILLKGRHSQWEVLPQSHVTEDLWDLEWFKGSLYASTMKNVFKLEGTRLEPIDYGKDKPKSCYQLTACDDVMWSSGEFDIMSFDGTSWVRVV